MRVSPRELHAVRVGGLVTRYATLDAAVFAVVDVGPTGSAGTALEEPCRLEHWGLVLKGEVTAVEGRRRRTFTRGTAFYVPPGPTHRFHAPARAVLAGFAPAPDLVDRSPEALRARGIEVIRRRSAPALPPTTIRVDTLPTRTATAGRIETESAEMGSWLLTRSRFGPLSGHADTWCDLPHWGLVLDGNVVLRWEDGGLELLGPGDVFSCPASGPGHRLEVADAATVVDYTPIDSIDDPARRRAPRLVAARGAPPALPIADGRPE
jgi:mannose-6-phosphate isomerase-like protein (cupin superfamily)